MHVEKKLFIVVWFSSSKNSQRFRQQLFTFRFLVLTTMLSITRLLRALSTLANERKTFSNTLLTSFLRSLRRVNRTRVSEKKKKMERESFRSRHKQPGAVSKKGSYFSKKNSRRRRPYHNFLLFLCLSNVFRSHLQWWMKLRIFSFKRFIH